MNALHDVAWLLGARTPDEFWNGIGNGALPWLATAALYLRHFNCHQPGCWRLGRVRLEGRGYCHRHHPLGRG